MSHTYYIVPDIYTDPKHGVTTVILNTYQGNQNYTVTGFARRNLDDPNDREIGNALAFARALKNLGRKMERDAYQRIHQSDAHRRAAQAQREERKAKREAERQQRTATTE